jgi:hypothetical protein
VADVFISYKRDERPAVESIAARLRDLGLMVWFDASMSAGEAFSDEIDREARFSKCILVCWSPGARESRWVKAEAMIGFEQDKLAAAYVSGPDGFSPPTPFNANHAEDLRAWLAAPEDAHAGWKSVLRRVGKLCGRADIESWGALDSQASAATLRTWLGQFGESPLFAAVDALLTERLEQDTLRAERERQTRERFAREEAERRALEKAEAQALTRQTHNQPNPAVADVPLRRGPLSWLAIPASVALLVVAVSATAYFVSPSMARSAETIEVARPAPTVLARLASTPTGTSIAEGVVITAIRSADGGIVRGDLAYADGAVGQVIYTVRETVEGALVNVRIEQHVGSDPVSRLLRQGDVVALTSVVANTTSADLNTLPNASFDTLAYTIEDLRARPFFYVEICSDTTADSVLSIVTQAMAVIPPVMRSNNLQVTGELMAVEPAIVSNQYCYQVGYPYAGGRPRALLIGKTGETPGGRALRVRYTGTEADIIAEVYDRMDALLGAAYLDNPATRDDDWITYEVFYDDPTQPGGSRNRDIYYVVPAGVDISRVTSIARPRNR